MWASRPAQPSASHLTFCSVGAADQWSAQCWVTSSRETAGRSPSWGSSRELGPAALTAFGTDWWGFWAHLAAAWTEGLGGGSNVLC